MPKKPYPKKSAKKAAPAPKAKAKPAAKPAPKPASKVVAKPASKVPAPKGKAAAPVKSAKAAPAPVAKKGAAPAAPVKNAKAAPAAKGKATKAPKVDRAVQKGMLDKHRDVHHQSAALDVPVRPKLQYYTLADLKAHLEKRNKTKSKLNVWVPDEERKAREKAAAAARSQGNRSNNIAAASIADLLGGSNPFRKGEGFVDESKQVPEKFRRYYRLLVDMRDALHKGLAFHSEEALKKSGKDDAGDL